MSFRRAKSDAYRRQREWNEWIDDHRAKLAAVGLPPEVYLDEDHWYDFLQNGCLDWHEGTGFEFSSLSPDQLRALGQILQTEYGDVPKSPPLLQWINVRIGRNSVNEQHV